eukprot:2386992-Pyramimonas_sp.AAC.1
MGKWPRPPEPTHRTLEQPDDLDGSVAKGVSKMCGIVCAIVRAACAPRTTLARVCHAQSVTG